MFEFLDAQGGWLEFAYRKYPGEPIQMIKMIHGEICDLPMGIIKHLNNTKRKIRRYNMELRADGKKVHVAMKQYRECDLLQRMCCERPI